MQQRERQTCVRKEHNTATLLKIIDEIDAARRLVDVAEMAATGLADSRERSALAELLTLVSQRLAAISADEIPSASDAA